MPADLLDERAEAEDMLDAPRLEARLALDPDEFTPLKAWSRLACWPPRLDAAALLPALLRVLELAEDGRELDAAMPLLPLALFALFAPTSPGRLPALA